MGPTRVLPLRPPLRTPVLPFAGDSARAGEHYRMIRARLAMHVRRPQTIVVSSAGVGDGKTVSAINIAGAFALSERPRVLLVDSDMRRSSLAAMLGLPVSPGLADILSGGCELRDALIRTEQLPRLHILPAGQAELNAAELLECWRWSALCAELRTLFDYIVLDAPPVGSVADFSLIEAISDGVLLVLRPSHSRRVDCLKAIEALPKERLLGLLINEAKDWPFWGRAQTYTYAAAKPPYGGGAKPEAERHPARREQ